MCFKLWRVFGIILAQLIDVLRKKTFQSLHIFKKWKLTVTNCSNKKNLKYMTYVYNKLLMTGHILISPSCPSKFCVDHYITSHVVRYSSLNHPPGTFNHNSIPV